MALISSSCAILRILLLATLAGALAAAGDAAPRLARTGYCQVYGSVRPAAWKRPATASLGTMHGNGSVLERPNTGVAIFDDYWTVSFTPTGQGSPAGQHHKIYVLRGSASSLEKESLPVETGKLHGEAFAASPILAVWDLSDSGNIQFGPRPGAVEAPAPGQMSDRRCKSMPSSWQQFIIDSTSGVAVLFLHWRKTIVATSVTAMAAWGWTQGVYAGVRCCGLLLLLLSLQMRSTAQE